MSGVCLVCLVCRTRGSQGSARGPRYTIFSRTVPRTPTVQAKLFAYDASPVIPARKEVFDDEFYHATTSKSNARFRYDFLALGARLSSDSYGSTLVNAPLILPVGAVCDMQNF